MVSNLIEVAGLVCLVECAYLYGGRALAFAAAGAALLFVGAVTEEDGRIKDAVVGGAVSLVRALARVRAGVRRVLASRPPSENLLDRG